MAMRDNDDVDAYDLDGYAAVVAVETNVAEAYADMAQNTHGDVYRGSDMVRYVSGIPTYLFNGVMNARLSAGYLDSAVEATLQAFAVRAAPMMWWVGPSTRPIGLGERLEAHGLTRAGESSGLVVDLASVDQRRQAISRLTFATVTDEEGLAAWARTAARGFGFDDGLGATIKEMALQQCSSPFPRWRYCLAYLDGQPVATAAIFLHAGIAGIYAVTTLADIRRRGFAAEIIRAALREAGSLGYRYGVAQSIGKGFPLYRKIGFRPCMSWISYSWAPELPLPSSA